MTIEVLLINDLLDALKYIADQEKWPNGSSSDLDMNRGTDFGMFEQSWNTFIQPDNWPRKPSWSDIIAAYEELQAIKEREEKLEQIKGLKEGAEGERKWNVPDFKAEFNTEEVALAGKNVHVGNGLTHMAGLIHMAEHANEAGTDLPSIILHDGKGNLLPMRRQAQIREVLVAAAAHKNALESAHNEVLARYYALAAIRDDEDEALDDRVTAGENASKLINNYKAELEKEIPKYDPDAMPEDADEVKAIYLERLETVALGKDKELRGYVTNQGVMLHPTCTDQSTAQQEVAIAYTNGAARIRKADDAALAKKAYDKASENIDAVEVKNTPAWLINNIAPVATYNLAKVLAHAKQPSGLDIPGEVEIISVKVTEGELVLPLKYHKLEAHPGDHAVELIVAPGKSAKVVLRARNLCGVSRLVVTLTNPITTP